MKKKEKQMTGEQDIVLIYFENNPMLFARIEDIRPDIKRDWFQVKLLLLQIPPQPITWILREPYINGESFTMDGKKIRLEKVVCPPDPREEGEEESTEAREDQSPGKVISITKRKKP